MKPARKKRTVTSILLLAAAKMAWFDWDRPCILSPAEHAALKKADLLDRRKCAMWLSSLREARARGKEG